MNVDVLNKLLLEANTQLSNKQNEIDDLKACQAINEKELQRLQNLFTETQRKKLTYKMIN